MSSFGGRSWSDLLDDAIRAMTSGEAFLAKRAFDELERAARFYVAEKAKSLGSAWEPFIALLGRRGYFVGNVAEMRNALGEIEAMGDGFDLYDLAASLSRCDTALAVHLHAPTARIFPELARFSRGG
jgi:hypothetical protein